MNLIPSNIKISLEGFNSCPARDELLEKLDNAINSFEYAFTDFEGKMHWLNNDCTAVVSVNGSDAYEAGVLVDAFHNANADEVQLIKTQGRVVIRAWWD